MHLVDLRTGREERSVTVFDAVRRIGDVFGNGEQYLRKFRAECGFAESRLPARDILHAVEAKRFYPIDDAEDGGGGWSGGERGGSGSHWVGGGRGRR